MTNDVYINFKKFREVISYHGISGPEADYELADNIYYYLNKINRIRKENNLGEAITEEDLR